jgi:hypothetical protein
VLFGILNSSDAADDTTESFRILRHSEYAYAGRIGFNRDLTTQQADAAYKHTVTKREQRNRPFSNAVGLKHAAPPFQAESC